MSSVSVIRGNDNRNRPRAKSISVGTNISFWWILQCVVPTSHHIMLTFCQTEFVTISIGIRRSRTVSTRTSRWLVARSVVRQCRTFNRTLLLSTLWPWNYWWNRALMVEHRPMEYFIVIRQKITCRSTANCRRRIESWTPVIESIQWWPNTRSGILLRICIDSATRTTIRTRTNIITVHRWSLMKSFSSSSTTSSFWPSRDVELKLIRTGRRRIESEQHKVWTVREKIYLNWAKCSK